MSLETEEMAFCDWWEGLRPSVRKVLDRQSCWVGYLVGSTHATQWAIKTAQDTFSPSDDKGTS